MTIDQLLADVTPLLPLSEADIYVIGTYNDDQQACLEKYLAHAGKHFPAMLAALRDGSILIANRNYAEAFGVLQKALAASEVCE